MGLLNRVVEFFVKDSAERKRFINEFNTNAGMFFQSLAVDTLLTAKICMGNTDNTYRHELSAPVIVSGICIEANAGKQITAEDIVMIGRIILSDQILVRRMFVLHWDTLIVRDSRTGKFVDWRIRDFLNFGGLLNGRN